MKKAAVLLFLVVFCVLMYFAERSFAVFQQVQSITVRETIFSPSGKELPFYFSDVKGIIQTNDPVKQRIEYVRYLNATQRCIQADFSFSSFILDPDSIKMKVDDLDSSSSITDDKAKFEIIFDQFVRQGPNKIRVTTLCGQEFITDHQFEVLKNFLIDQMKEARDIGFDYYGPIPDYVVKKRAERLSISENDYRNMLNEKDPRFSQVLIRELHRVPLAFKKSDFVIRQLHFGYHPDAFGALGLAWLDTGVVYYNMQTSIIDYLSDYPKVLLHEAIHNNSKLQNWPFTSMDVELMASLPEMLMPKNQIDFFFHSYARKLRELSYDLFGYNFEQARDEIFLFDYAGNILIDETKYRQHFKTLETIKPVMLDAAKEAVYEYFSDELWWSAMNRRWAEDTSVFDIMMSLRFEPTILGGRVETEKWLAPREEEIKEGMRLAWLKTKEKNDDHFSEMRVPRFVLNQYKNLFTEKEQEVMRQYFMKNPKSAELISKMSSEQLINFFSSFKSKEIGIGGVK